MPHLPFLVKHEHGDFKKKCEKGERIFKVNSQTGPLGEWLMKTEDLEIDVHKATDVLSLPCK